MCSMHDGLILKREKEWVRRIKFYHVFFTFDVMPHSHTHYIYIYANFLLLICASTTSAITNFLVLSVTQVEFLGLICFLPGKVFKVESNSSTWTILYNLRKGHVHHVIEYNFLFFICFILLYCIVYRKKFTSNNKKLTFQESAKQEQIWKTIMLNNNNAVVSQVTTFWHDK